MAQTILHKADTRGVAKMGWLNSHHTFSFGGYHDPGRMHFGMLRVLNDDEVAPGMGFGTHPHDNMEIISIPLEGDLEHKDSMGNTTVIRAGDVQVMSAGTGISHSERNKNHDAPVKFLQIWIVPGKRNMAPRYDQITTVLADRRNKLQQILSPRADDAGVWVYQDAWMHVGQFDEHYHLGYEFRKAGDGVYAFVLSGQFSINGQKLDSRDGYGVWDAARLDIIAQSPGAELLLIEVPMN